MIYTDKVLDHFMNPRNVGEISDADGVGQIGDEECGDMVKVWIKVANVHLIDIKYKVFGCPAAIAVCSMMSEMAMGKHVDDAYEITDAQVAEALGGLPAQKYHCSNLAASALQKAIMNFALKKPCKNNTVAITTLVNNSAPDNLQSEHGLSFWIEFEGRHILFDTGQSDIVIKNAKLLNINLANTEAIVLSHGHYDHTGGVPAVVNIARKVNIYLHPEALKPKFGRKNNKTKAIGMPDSSKQVVLHLAGNKKVILTKSPTELSKGLFVTGSIPRKTNFEDTGGNFCVDENCTNPDELLDDQAIHFKSNKGLVVPLGCAHAGVVNTLDHIVNITGEKHIHAVLGGMHLVNASSERIDRTIEAMKKYGIQELGLAHCTGNNAMQKMKDAFPGQCFECSVGTQRKFVIHA
ncbi:MAG: iron-sulfur cluster assembly scaffold protein [Planctomycetes bacterium]|nr:iron-sulfur cluster assembly scaffold protein [Planctomycetota bacterium]